MSHATASGATERRRYTYRRGRAIVFGAGFEHSTEPGRCADGQPHAYLCFTFGTDRQAAWEQISRTLDTQSRIVCQPDGTLGLSHLGRELERMIEEASASAPS